MKILALKILGFRGIQSATIRFGLHDVLVGPNSAGKSTIVDALSLVFGRTKLVRDLTEHDFYGSCPIETSRIVLIATLSGFDGNTPEGNESGFREGRAVPKWWNKNSGNAEPEPNADANELCAQIGFAARFDLEELSIETIRYFHDDDEIVDPFIDDLVQQVPIRLLDDIGFYVLPVRRTWEGAASFASELFRKAVATIGGIPAQAIIEERDRLRSPVSPLERDPGLIPLVNRINEQLSHILPTAPQFQLRVTSTDSESLLRSLSPHYSGIGEIGLPVGRHGMGLLSLQTFILLLELGRERRRRGKPFIFAMEEPELHIPPGIQRKLVAQAISIADQTICTSHSPRVAAYYPATSVQVLDRRENNVVSTPLLEHPLDARATNALRKLCNDDRPRVIEALMQHKVLIPEGRSEYEWFRLISEKLEISDITSNVHTGSTSFGTIIGVIPTQDSAVEEIFNTLWKTRKGIIPLVDGDRAGNEKIQHFLNSDQCPEIILQWRDEWTIENVIEWIINGADGNILVQLQEHIEHNFETIEELIGLFKNGVGPRRLKTDYLTYEIIANLICENQGSRERVCCVLNSLSQACIGNYDGSEVLIRDNERSNEHCVILRITL